MTSEQGTFPIRFPRDIAILSMPQWVRTETPAWIDHIPFAFWIIGAAEPRLLVELGTHYGNSYFAFAQAVQDQGLPTAMYAVDHWKGDEHSELYGEEVFTAVAQHNERGLAGFSTLLRATFDEALAHFDDGEVDLLHIDGHHTYESVKHDFDSWQPKLSTRAVVLFHDTAVRERDFGVHRLWAELAERYPAFAFDHGHGLGVVAIGPDVPETVRPLVELGADSPDAVAVRRLFAALGHRVALEARGPDTVQREVAAALQTARSEYEQETDELRAEHAAVVAALEARVAREIEAARLEVTVADARAASAFDERLKAIMEQS